VYMLIECMRSALAALRAHSFRSILTGLGIVIGVGSVIAVIAIVQGLSQAISAQFQSLGSGSITIRSFTPLQQQLQGQRAILTEADLQTIRHEIDGISHITPVLFDPTNGSSVVGLGSRNALTRVFGVGSAYLEVNQIFPREGRFFTRDDESYRRMVCIVGTEVSRNLEIPQPVLGQFLRVGQDWCKVIGVMESRGELFGFSQDDYILLPFTTMQRLLGSSREYDIQIQLLVGDAERSDEVIGRIKRVLRSEHKLGMQQADDFRVQTSEQLAASFNTIINAVTAVAVGIVGISLLVGGIGIMNIMLVSVTERTREIGILKALGARRADILLQFLIEAVLICLLGGAAGLALGYGVGALVTMMLPGAPAIHVPLWAVGLSVGFSATVGVLFGVLPATKAAQLDPIQALRYE
jgi:putative ABC transport system permease protein